MVRRFPFQHGLGPDELLWWGTEVADVLGSVAVFAVCNSMALSVNASDPGSVTV